MPIPRNRPRPPLPQGLDVFRPDEVIASTVLVVEDEAPMLAQLELDLKLLGYQPRTAADAETARHVLSEERIAGILLDLILDEREETGFELLRWIRQHHPGLPVVVLSAANASSASIRRAFELGASSYFVKGAAGLGHIYSDLGARLAEGGGSRGGSYMFGRLEFDPVRRTVSLGSKQIRLTSQQTSLLVHLSHGSKAATAGDLIEAGLFRPDAARSTVHSALLTLRRKLDELEPGLGGRFLSSTARGYSLSSTI